MRKLYFTASLIALSLSSYAQGNYKPGFLVTLTGDTTMGVINYREWGTNPTSIDFKTSLADNNRQTVRPADVAGFGITNFVTYQTYTGPISNDETNTNKLSNERDTSFKIDKVFLKVLQKGGVLTLYQYADDMKIRYFISEGLQTPKELGYRVYYVANGSISENTYKKQLSSIAIQHGMLDDKLNLYIQKSDYGYSDILNIVSRLNNIKSAKEDGNSAPATYFYAGLGVNITSFKTGGPYRAAGGKPYTSIMPRALAGLNIYASPNTQSLAFRLEFGVGADRYESNYTSLVSPYNDVVFHFTQLSFSLTPQVIYNIYNQPNFKFYTGIGFQASLIQYVDKVFQNKDGSAFSTFRGTPFAFNKNFNNFIAKAGFTLNKKIDVYVNYVSISNLNEDNYFQISSTGIQAGVNYIFK
jgi:hypothetical protein